MGFACFSISGDDVVAEGEEGFAFVINQLASGPEIETVTKIV